MAIPLVCWNCGHSLKDIPLPISRHANCSACFEVLHCCRMCRHYAPDKRPYCDHERADPPVVKENANFCDYFKPANRYSPKEADQAGKARSQLDDLFGTPSDGEDDPENPADVDFSTEMDHDARRKFNDLFND